MPRKKHVITSRRWILLHELYIGFHHVLDEGFEVDFGLPSKEIPVKVTFQLSAFFISDFKSRYECNSKMSCHERKELKLSDD